MLLAKKITQIKWNSSFLIPLFYFTLLFITGFWISRNYSFLLYHSLAELFGILVAFGIFILAWNSREVIKNNYLLFIGVAYLFVGILDLFHTLAYEGMGVFKGYDANLATQLWIAARYMESLSLLVAPLFIHRKLKASVVFSVYSMALFLIFMSIFQWHIFPGCFVNGPGLTPFKKISEYIISGILAISIIPLWKRRGDFDKKVLSLIIISIITTICSDLVLTSYTSIYGSSNFIGHFLKIFSFWPGIPGRSSKIITCFSLGLHTCLLVFWTCFTHLHMTEWAYLKGMTPTWPPSYGLRQGIWKAFPCWWLPFSYIES
jgi:hypothetical protein